MRVFTGMLIAGLIAVSASACKTREPDQAGLLSAAAEVDEEAVADGGEYSVRCASDDDASTDAYMILVRGAVNPADESQPLTVDVDHMKKGAGQPQRLFAGLLGRGAIDLKKSVFIGFESGALTADAADDPAAGFTGVLSIAGHVDGQAVRCQAAPLTPDPK